MTRAALLGAVTAAPGCGIAPAEPEAESAAPLALVAVVQAGDSVHRAALLGFGRPLLGAGSRMVVRRGGVVEAGDSRTVDSSCFQLGGGERASGGRVGTFVCLEYPLGAQPSDEVRIEAWAPGFDTIRGRTNVPGAFDFQVVSAGTSGPGEWRVSWTPSAGASSYLVEAFDSTTCYPDYPCEVLRAMRTTERSVVLPPVEGVENARIAIRVSALDPNLDAFVTTGVPGQTFSKLPISSVQGGIGVVGSLTRGTPRHPSPVEGPQL